MNFIETDRRCMARALELASRGRYSTHPNPRVGCVLAHEGRIVGEGWHQRAGGPHAEVFALQQAGAAAKGATAYITLEPCAHYGRTPPCSLALIEAGIRRAVVACQDPFHQVDGNGLRLLREAGIEVEVGLLREEAEALNLGFLSNARRGRPWVRLKYGMSLDGRTALADGESKWITSEASRHDVQLWRQASSAILTSSATVLADDPQLTVRIPFDQPVPPVKRIVLDRWSRVPAQARVFDTQAPTLVAHRYDNPPATDLADHVERLPLLARDDEKMLWELMEVLGERSIHDLFVEAGARLGGALIKAGLVDELLLYVAPRLLGANARPLIEGLSPDSLALAPGFELYECTQLGDDVRLRLRAKARGIEQYRAHAWVAADEIGSLSQAR
ncbi:bifunctional diaminohydroxyphosphoribosylaminopyrimidine deaminase/5-amino-6-(5-phosphoribosylamino)uracil reductase RibD [Pseudomonas chengduensis]|uniref:Riboflavin biosynthesis protein RibD n=2 Tax=Ectopseudomonas TaxID=3236654 RepID=A0A1G6VNT3_9GAMM|nr:MULTISPECIES: bifunctional diaminohydroxyphosphoribosylaminopyrimidine deaminase/5-amino-6-(5-phosphoribosylamino)uracil reductase RibD [Pseudomonas]MDH1340364.1 bifunctional diaminohydroxyphosphoribosylaminopyrimidine deaminase/5-amino-6-(5-phosphoribosylamino)uracil reductase RibD [Pseudomonas oleovorans]MDH1492060.1 bifunctional diaminohydroxyphosphoribosylaminopyrimidine deaminase/5-amino-6-(5-phosphoribosylamino)uracil reductase RibD [Pseudomonas oleovorans]MDH1682382.1 bifunctional diam